MMKYKKTITIGIVILMIALVLFALFNSTYALFSSEAYGANPEVYSTGLLSIEAKSKSDNISLTNAIPMSDDDGKSSTPYVFTIKNNGNLDYKFNIKLLSTSSNTFSSQYIKLQIDDGAVTTLSALTNSIIKSDITLVAGESIDISLRIWLDIATPNSEIGKSFESKIVTDGQAVYTSSNKEVSTLVNHIKYLYEDASKGTVVNNKIEYNYANIYDIDDDDTTSGGLMNDRLGGTSDNYDAGNIRYYGATPNNYIDIGDRDSSGNVILWRIIGVFKDVELEDGSKQDLVKVIRNDSIGKYSWDTSSSTVNSGYGVNEWSQADLMKLLNLGYNSNTDIDSSGSSIIVNNSLYWNSESGYCYIGVRNDSGNCDFTDKGLNSSVQSKIASVVWNLGGHNSSSVYPNQIYNYERGTDVVIPGTTCSGIYCNDTVTRTTKWTGKIALMYPSDYGYAVDLNSCIETVLSDYGSDACYNKDWLLYSDKQWLLTPISGSTNHVWYINKNGSVGNNSNVFIAHEIRPVFYLNSELVIVAGNGTEALPYVVR